MYNGKNLFLAGAGIMVASCATDVPKSFEQKISIIENYYNEAQSEMTNPEFKDAVEYLMSSNYGRNLSEIGARIFVLKAVDGYGLKGGLQDSYIDIVKKQIAQYKNYPNQLNAKTVHGKPETLKEFSSKEGFFSFLDETFTSKISISIKKEINKKLGLKPGYSGKDFSLDINSVGEIFFSIDKENHIIYVNKEQLLKEFLEKYSSDTYRITPADFLKYKLPETAAKVSNVTK